MAATHESERPPRLRSGKKTIAGGEFGSDLEGFVEFSKLLRIEGKKPLILYREELLMLEQFFGGCPETVIIIPKKNGKTTLLSAVALHHLATTSEADCVIGASSRDQATLLYNQAVKMIRNSGLEDVFQSQQGYRRIRYGDGGTIRVLASDDNTADGVIPSLALVDELHRHPSGGLYGVFFDGLSGRDGQMITISTAGDDENSPLGRLRKRAYALPGLKRDGAYRHVATPEFAMHEWALDASDDRNDLELVKTANPAPWQTVEKLKMRRDSPSMTPWQWARFACGVWVYGEASAISEQEWRACEDPDAEIPAGAEGVYVGVDLGWRDDTTALVPVWRNDDVLVVGPCHVLEPPGDGSALAYERVWDAVEQLVDQYGRPTFVLDPHAGGEQLAQQIDRENLGELVLYSQQNKGMCLAAQRFSEAVAGGKLKHRGDPTLSAHVLAAAPRPVGEMWRLQKPKTGAKIDACIALAMAVSMASEAPTEVFAAAW